jgi:hypothetical protein
MPDQDMKAFLLKQGYAAIAWAGSPQGKAQFEAAMEFARRAGIPVTEAEVCAILLAAQEAVPADDPSGKTRLKRELKFEAEGGDDNELPRQFQLLSWNTPQVQDRRYAGGWVSDGAAMRTVLAGGIGRRELEQLLAGGISELAWDGSLDG